MSSSISSLIQNLKTSLLFILLAYCLYFLFKINSKTTNCNCHVTSNQFECLCRCITDSSSTCNSSRTENHAYLRSKILEESENNWEKFVRKRQENIMKFGGVYTRNMAHYNNLYSIWDIFSTYYSCPFYKEVCGLDHLAQKPTPCIVYSYGVSADYSFEQEILARTNCSVFMYDHTIQPKVVQPLLDQYEGRVQVRTLGIGARKTEKLHTLKEEMDLNGHQFIDIVKMDVEGSEYKVFEQIIQDYPHGLPLPFAQLQIELHLPRSLSTFVNFWLSVEKAGLRAFHTGSSILINEKSLTLLNLFYIEPNNYHGVNETVYYQGAAEYSFINVKVDNYLITDASNFDS